MRWMHFLRGFLALRRQSDKVKLALLLYLLAAWLGVQAVGDILDYGKAAGKPVEYVLMPDASGAVLAAKLEALYKTEGIVSITPQWEEDAAERSRNTLEAPAYRVLCDTADLSGMTLHRAEALGFTPAEAEAGEVQALQAETLRIRLFYSLLACGTSALAGWALYRLGKVEILAAEDALPQNSHPYID